MINLPHSMPAVSFDLLERPTSFPVEPSAYSRPSFTPYPSDSDIIPNDIQNRLMFWRDIFKTGQFDIGDLAASVVLWNAERGMRITHKRIFQAMSTFCGKTPRTVRYYYEAAVFYPIEVRQQYDALPFSHFVEARMFGDGWQNYLETAMLNPHRSPEYIRNIVIAPTQTSQLLTPFVAVPPVAVGVAVGVGADISNHDQPKYAPNYEPETSEKNNCEISQDGTDNVANIRRSPVAPQSCEVSQVYSQHTALCRVDALMAAVKDVLPILTDVRIDDFTRAKLASACGDLLHYLPKVGEVIAHSERMV